MHLELSDEKNPPLWIKELHDTVENDPDPFSQRIRTAEGDPRQAEAGAGARTLAAAEALRAAASDDGQTAPLGALTLKSEPGPPMTLRAAAGAGVRLIVWCRDCSHQVEPDPAEMAARYGAETTVIDWRGRLVCSRCGSRQIDMVVSGTKRRREVGEPPTPPLVNRSAGVVTPMTPSAVIVLRQRLWRDEARSDQGYRPQPLRSTRSFALAAATVCHCMFVTASGPPQASGST